MPSPLFPLPPHPLSAQRVLPGLYDPTGLTFEQPGGGVSTELGAILGGPGAFRLIPSLVPGQVDMQNILAGRKPAGSNWGLTPQQEKIMNAYAKTRSAEVPTFSTLGAAEDYEQRRHRGLDAGYLPTRPEDVISSLYGLLGAIGR